MAGNNKQNPVRQRSRPDYVKLFDGIFSHVSRVALLQYFLSGTFLFLFITDAKSHLDIPVDLR